MQKIELFFSAVVSPGSDTAVFLREYFYCNMSFCDPQIERIPKSSSSIEFPLCWNSLFSKNTNLKPFFQVSIRNVPPVKEYYFGKSVLLCLGSQSLKSENSEKCHRYLYLVFQIDFSPQLQV